MDLNTNTLYFSYSEVFQSRCPFYVLIANYFDRSRPYKVELADFTGAQVYKVSQEV